MIWVVQFVCEHRRQNTWPWSVVDFSHRGIPPACLLVEVSTINGHTFRRVYRGLVVHSVKATSTTTCRPGIVALGSPNRCRCVLPSIGIVRGGTHLTTPVAIHINLLRHKCGHAVVLCNGVLSYKFRFPIPRRVTEQSGSISWRRGLHVGGSMA